MASEEKSVSVQGQIPRAIFVEDVESFMKKPENSDARAVLKTLDEQHNKYKFMDYNLATKRARLLNQIPDIKSSLDIVTHMKSKKAGAKPLSTQFRLSDNLYVKAKVPPTEKVCLWLGANVMLEYTLEAADELLQKNLTAAAESLEQVEEDLSFIRDQTTTVEVNMARVYNWDVKRKQALNPTAPAAVTS
ncbi:hypothetical protein CAPTEDRAFT_168351 [Capitella teleta]|uniref:Prefoldin subunit 3 n=1 Tax=Capitella teleta TaxID=283909 RepID=R7TD73_CAPTE|nr:hypothetical protein CAPTEDRAFT_168351 [Capitella teleta]|eukprot:ELT89016.1 hypothetical protein CAPTEDRAFT_168351 [Capitella teleta]